MVGGRGDSIGPGCRSWRGGGILGLFFKRMRGVRNGKKEGD